MKPIELIKILLKFKDWKTAHVDLIKDKELQTYISTITEIRRLEFGF